LRAPEFWWRTDPAARLAAAALWPLGAFYGATVAVKQWLRIPWCTRAAVICVGNLTVGGTGKTPVVIAIAQALQQAGLPVACLARGYGRNNSRAALVDLWNHDARRVGDEPLLLARTATTIVARDRAKGARLARAQGARAVVMDDGHQNFALAKDLSLVVVDGETGFGNRGIVPAGPLRESVKQGLARADAVVIMGEGTPRLAGFDGPVLRAKLSADKRLDGKRVVAFAGIGRPAKFFGLLRTLGANLAGTESFADHHVYSARELSALRRKAESATATLITTEKDFARLRPAERSGIEALHVRAVFDDQPALKQLLHSVIEKARACP
jgi:tetraacyldisaccharide 4'-kinase